MRKRDRETDGRRATRLSLFLSDLISLFLSPYNIRYAYEERERESDGDKERDGLRGAFNSLSLSLSLPTIIDTVKERDRWAACHSVALSLSLCLDLSLSLSLAGEMMAGG